MKILKTIIGILLIPVAIGAGKSFYEIASSINLISGLLNVLERGVLVYLLIHVLIARPVYLYVLGHEFVHVMATWICGGKVVSFNVTRGGGKVVTSKSNFFIELSPYFIPIYTIGLSLIFLILKFAGITGPSTSTIFIFLVGVTLAFHFVMTTEVLKLEQPDLLKSGALFSLVLIFLCNIVITMLVLAPIFDAISFKSFLIDSFNNSIGVYEGLYNAVIEIINSIKF